MNKLTSLQDLNLLCYNLHCHILLQLLIPNYTNYISIKLSHSLFKINSKLSANQVS